MVRGGRKRVTRGDMVREDMSCCYWLPVQCTLFLNHTLSRVEAWPVGKVLSTILIEEMKLFIVAPEATSTEIHLQKKGIWKESQILPMGLGGRS